MTPRRVALAVLVGLVLVGLVLGWAGFRCVRADYDAYRAKIQQGTKVAGVDVGWLTPEEARAEVEERVARPYYRDLTLRYQDRSLSLSPASDLNLQIPVNQMVDEAMAASHQTGYWPGFWRWLGGNVESLTLDVPLQVTFDESATARFLSGAAKAHDLAPTEPMVDVQTLTFLPGRPGIRLDVEKAAELVNQRVPDPGQREVTLPFSIVQPDQSPGRIESMLNTLGPVMERPPTVPSFYTATLPLSSSGGLAGTPLVTYTGELTWTFPYFAEYTGPLTTTYGFFFEPGLPGSRFDVERATRQVEAALEAGVTTPITFEADPVPPPPFTPDLLRPPVKARLAGFPGVSSLLVKNLDTGEVVFDSNSDYVLSGMSVVKIGIMVEVYRYYEGAVDEQTHQELMAMLGRESCNPCANRLLAEVGGGSALVGAQKVTQTMRRLGLKQFSLCAAFRVVEDWGNEGQIVLAANASPSPLAGINLVQAGTPRYDRCVHATSREMADLTEMIYECTQDKGPLRKGYPKAFTPQICQGMIDIMAANDLRNMLGAGIPAEAKLAHKHGFAGYDVPWGDTRAEVGIVFSPGAAYLVSFYIWEDTPWIDFGIAQPLYRDVSNMLYNYFNPEAPYWAPPPWAPPRPTAQ